MIDKQPEALRLADCLSAGIIDREGIDTLSAAAELRRLHTEVDRLTECMRRANGLAEHFERHWFLRGDQIDELVEALKYCRQKIAYMTEHGEWYSPGRAIEKADAAIAKATGKTP